MTFGRMNHVTDALTESRATEEASRTNAAALRRHLCGYPLHLKLQQ